MPPILTGDIGPNMRLAIADEHQDLIGSLAFFTQLKTIAVNIRDLRDEWDQPNLGDALPSCVENLHLHRVYEKKRDVKSDIFSLLRLKPAKYPALQRISTDEQWGMVTEMSKERAAEVG